MRHPPVISYFSIKLFPNQIQSKKIAILQPTPYTPSITSIKTKTELNDSSINAKTSLSKFVNGFWIMFPLQ
jgi:hypothetical protein